MEVAAGSECKLRITKDGPERVTLRQGHDFNPALKKTGEVYGKQSIGSSRPDERSS